MKAKVVERVLIFVSCTVLAAFYLFVLNSARPEQLRKSVSERYWNYFIEKSSARY